MGEETCAPRCLSFESNMLTVVGDIYIFLLKTTNCTSRYRFQVHMKSLETHIAQRVDVISTGSRKSGAADIWSDPIPCKIGDS